MGLYRAGVGQLQAQSVAGASRTAYCKSYAASGIFIAQQQALFSGKTSPAPAVANNLFTFMARCFAASFGAVPALGCTTIFGIAALVTLITDANGVVTAARIDTASLASILAGKSLAQATHVFGHGMVRCGIKGGIIPGEVESGEPHQIQLWKVS
jgi:hypothetical protein